MVKHLPSSPTPKRHLLPFDSYSPNPLVFEIQKHRCRLHTRLKVLKILLYIMSISLSNEQVHKAAFQTETLELLITSFLKELQRDLFLASDYYASLKREFDTCWHEYWEKDTQNLKLCTVKPLVMRLSLPLRFYCHWEVVLARLRIGHTIGYLTSRETPGLSILPIAHFS